MDCKQDTKTNTVPPATEDKSSAEPMTTTTKQETAIDMDALKSAIQMATEEQNPWQVQTKPRKPKTKPRRGKRESRMKKRMASQGSHSGSSALSGKHNPAGSGASDGANRKKPVAMQNRAAPGGERKPARESATPVGSTEHSKPSTSKAAVTTETERAGPQSHSSPKPPQQPKKGKKKKRKKIRASKTVQSKDEEARPAKRGRPDDTISPQTSTKRAKPNRSAMKTAGTSYAEAVGDQSIRVAIFTKPFRQLTEEQVNGVLAALHQRMDETILDPTSIVPTFRGKPHHSEGTLKMWCEDGVGVEWLQKATAGLSSPIPGTRLVVGKVTDIPRRVRCGLFIPSKMDTQKMMRAYIARMNPWYNVVEWILYDDTETDTGHFLMLGIPHEDIPKITARERRVCYGFGWTYFQFIGEETKEATPESPPTANQGGGQKDKAGTSRPSPDVPPTGPTGLSGGTATPAAMRDVASSSRLRQSDSVSESVGVVERPDTPESRATLGEPEMTEAELLLSDGPSSSPTKHQHY